MSGATREGMGAIPRMSRASTYPFAVAQREILAAYAESDALGDRAFATHHATITREFRLEMMRYPTMRASFDDSLSEIVSKAWDAWRRGKPVQYREHVRWHDSVTRRSQDQLKRSMVRTMESELLEAAKEASVQRGGRVRGMGGWRTLVHPPHDAPYVDALLERISEQDLRIAQLRAAGYENAEVAGMVGMNTAGAVSQRLTRAANRALAASS